MLEYDKGKEGFGRPRLGERRSDRGLGKKIRVVVLVHYEKRKEKRSRREMEQGRRRKAEFLGMLEWEGGGMGTKRGTLK